MRSKITRAFTIPPYPREFFLIEASKQFDNQAFFAVYYAGKFISYLPIYLDKLDNLEHCGSLVLENCHIPNPTDND